MGACCGRRDSNDLVCEYFKNMKIRKMTYHDLLKAFKTYSEKSVYSQESFTGTNQKNLEESIKTMKIKSMNKIVEKELIQDSETILNKQIQNAFFDLCIKLSNSDESQFIFLVFSLLKETNNQHSDFLNLLESMTNKKVSLKKFKDKYIEFVKYTLNNTKDIVVQTLKEKNPEEYNNQKQFLEDKCSEKNISDTINNLFSQFEKKLFQEKELKSQDYNVTEEDLNNIFLNNYSRSLFVLDNLRNFFLSDHTINNI